MKILVFIVCVLMNLSLMFLVFFIEFCLIARFNIIVKPYLQFLLIFVMISFAVLVGYFVSIFIVENIIVRLFDYDQ